MHNTYSRQDEARRAFGDVEQSILAHGRVMEAFNIEVRKNGALRNRAVVLAGSAGVCASAICLGFVRAAPWRFAHFFTFSDAGGALGAGSVAAQALKMFMVSAMMGLTLAITATTSFKLERDIYDLELRREIWEIENHLSGELQEMISIYKAQGLTEEEALIVTRIFAKEKDLFANLMMVEELGYSRLVPPRISEATMNVGIPTVVGYVFGSFAPMLSLLLPLTLVRSKDGMTSLRELRGTPAERVMSLVPRLLLNSMGEITLAACCAVMGSLHTEVFFGAYSHLKLRVQLIGMSLAGAGAVYALSFLTAKCF
ncbi:unnamed protein product [Phytomonas sp. EM1]|nr:unnamed protein product [Phytomonas sp. EM1]|eukprot:CCW59710.1 unnamed protein product [Phytomonas sp. isolate EM1]